MWTAFVKHTRCCAPRTPCQRLGEPEHTQRCKGSLSADTPHQSERLTLVVDYTTIHFHEHNMSVSRRTTSTEQEPFLFPLRFGDQIFNNGMVLVVPWQALTDRELRPYPCSKTGALMPKCIISKVPVPDYSSVSAHSGIIAIESGDPLPVVSPPCPASAFSLGHVIQRS